MKSTKASTHRAPFPTLEWNPRVKGSVRSPEPGVRTPGVGTTTEVTLERALAQAKGVRRGC